MTLILLITSLLTRLIFLYFGHPSITHDEADYFINAFLLAQTGSDIFNQRIFLSSGILYSTSAFPVYWLSLFFIFIDKTVINSRLPFALLNSLAPVLVYLIVKKMTKNKTLGTLSFIVMNFSPWFSYLSTQSAFDSPVSLTLFLAAFYILLTRLKNSTKYIFFTLLAFFSFNSYMGIKTSFLFLIFTAFIGKAIYDRKKISFPFIGKKLFISLLLTMFFFILVSVTPSSSHFYSRLKEKVLPLNTQILADKVDYERSIAPENKIIKELLFNKLTVFISFFVERYAQAYNPITLFIKDSQHVIYSNNYFGLFYIFDLFFLIAGLYFSRAVLKKNARVALIFFLLLIGGAIPLGLTVDVPNIAIRSFPLIFPYVFFISLGFYQLLKTLFKKEKIIISAALIMYFCAFCIFFTVYVVSIKNASAVQWHKLEKTLSDKLNKTIKKYPGKKIVVYVNEPRETLLLYLYYKENDSVKIKSSLSRKNSYVDNLYFSSDCPEKKLRGSFQIIHSERCPVDEKVFTKRLYVAPENKLSPSYFLLK